MTSPHFPFAAVADASLRLSAAVMLLGCVRPWLRRWVGSQTLAALWLMLTARLLMPWPVAASWGWPGPLGS